MRAENKIIRSLWIGRELSKIELLCICSFLKNGHEFHLYCYEDIYNIPEGVKIKDANEIFPANEIFLDSIGSLAGFSDMFRYKLIYEYGGWWTDMDIICLKPLDFSQDFVFATERFRYLNEQEYLTASCIFKSPPKSEFLSDLINYIEINKNTITPLPWSSFGPRLLHQILKNYDSKPYIQCPNIFCPINWDELHIFFESDFTIDETSCYTIHLWNEMWRKHKIDKNSTFNENSLIENYKRKFLNMV
ncbi:MULTISPECIES: glycosyltransferase [Bacteroidota]|uniref:glycosyltransferase n=1 Tax=Bacteroidota TaxID=976 RepID=UPI0008A35871|nr:MULTISPECIES: glycosyltransferase [Bacteroidota]OFV17716.1 hypothetical protein HMPREF3127_08410 [Sphingobacterium sp. HMSC13C05]